MEYHRNSHRTSRHYRRNPDGGLGREAGLTLLATTIGVAVSVGVEKVINGMTKEGAVPAGAPTGAKLAKYSDNKVSAITAGVCGVLGIALHVKDIAPRVGKALMAGGGALAVSRYVAHREDAEATRAARIAGSRGIEVAPVLVSNGAAGYLPMPSNGAVGPQYGTVPSGAAVGAQYGTMYH